MKLTTTTGKQVDVILKSPELRDKWVKLVHPINNAIHQMDAGAFMQIRSYGGGLGKFTLITPKCPHCGVASFISHVSQNSFELHADVDAAGKPVWLAPVQSKPGVTMADQVCPSDTTHLNTTTNVKVRAKQLGLPEPTEQVVKGDIRVVFADGSYLLVPN